MTVDDIRAFLASVGGEATAALARLDAVDPDALPATVRAEYEEQRRGWRYLLAMTEDDVVELHAAACEYAGRELTAEELRGLARVL